MHNLLTLNTFIHTYTRKQRCYSADRDNLLGYVRLLPTHTYQRQVLFIKYVTISVFLILIFDK